MAVQLVAQGDVAVITMDDGRANAMNPTFLGELNGCLDQSSGAAAILIAGRAGNFSGGLDLKLLPTLSSEGRREAVELFTTVMMRIWEFPRPTVAAVTGHALAGGAILALTADIRYFLAGGYRFGLIEVPMGVPLPGFAIEMASSVVSGVTLTELVAHGRTYTSDETFAAGIAQATYPAERLLEAGLERASQLAKLPGDAYASTKARMRADSLRRARAAVATETDLFMSAFEAMLQRQRRS